MIFTNRCRLVGAVWLDCLFDKQTVICAFAMIELSHSEPQLFALDQQTTRVWESSGRDGNN